MRRILVSYARMKKAEKRGAGASHVPVESVVVAAQDRPADLVALDEALSELERLDERQARVVEMKYFGGMTNAEVAEAIGVSERTVEGDWSMARKWLRRQLSEQE